MSAAAPPLVALAGARLGYRDRVILEDVDLEVRRGDFLAIVGPNGAGKTTALRTILGIIPPLAGRCEARGRLGYSPQRGALDPIFPFTAAEVVAMGLLAEQRARGRAHADEAVRRALAACGMEARRDAAFRDLSGGQKQRVLVARALVSAPDVLVLDEPTNDLDLRGEHEVMELVRALHDQGRTVVMVSHMLHVVARYARRIAFVRGGRVVAGDLERMLTAEQLAPLYDGLPVVVGRLAGHAVVAPGRGGGAEAAAEVDVASPAPSVAPRPTAPAPAPETPPSAGALGLADLAWRLAAACLAGMTVAGLMAARGERAARHAEAGALREQLRQREDAARVEGATAARAVRELSERGAELAVVRGALAEARARVDLLEDDRRALGARAAALDARREALEEALRRSERHVEAARRLAADALAAQHPLRDERDVSRELADEAARRAAGHERDLDAARARLAAVAGDLAGAQARLTGLEAELAQALADRAELDRARGRVAALEADLVAARAELAAARAERDAAAGARDALAREVAALRAKPGAPRELEVHDDALDLTRLDLPRGALVEVHLPEAYAAGEPRLEAGGRLLWPAPADAGPGLRFWVLSDDLPPDGRLRLVGGRAGRRAEVQALPLPAGAAARVGALLRAAGVVGGGA